MPKGPLRILLMEDDAGLARLCQKSLEKAGHVVDHAADGEQGLVLCEKNAYDLLAVDHVMPVYDGLEVIRRLALRGPLPPIIMITGAGNERIAVEAMKLGAYDYVVKDTEAVYLDLLPAVIDRAIRQRRVEEHFRLAAKVFESAAEGIVIADSRAQVVSVNQAFTAITGYAPEEVVGKDARAFQSDLHDAKFYRETWAALTGTGVWHGEVWNRRKNGEAYPVWLTLSVVKDERGQTTHYAGIFMDVTTQKQAEEYLRHRATHDPLTDLPNRDLFRDRLTRVLSLAHREKRMAAVMMLDLDHFKPINDNLGHATGDRVLQGVARRLFACLRDCDTAARFGGDEFAVLLPEITEAEDAALVAQRILEALAIPFAFDGRECSISASIGISLYPEHGATADALMSSADSAMYCAKETRNCYELLRPAARLPSAAAT
jgi:diguanylate cyclase (GGDEF)-like protein/PAS domain S-box-containing protein